LKFLGIEDFPGYGEMNRLGLNEPGRNGKFALSASGCNDLDSCSMKFKYLRIDKLPSKQAMPLVYGNALHDCFEEMMNQKKRGEPYSLEGVLKSQVNIQYGKPETDELEKVWFSHEGEDWSDMVPTREVLEAGLARLKASCEVFRTQWMPNLEPVFMEPQMLMPVPGGEDEDLHAIGYIDLGAMYNGEFYIVDYKSAAKLPTKDKVTGEYKIDAAYRQQLVLYAGMIWNWVLPEDGQKVALLYTSKEDQPRQIWVEFEISQFEVDAVAYKFSRLGKIIKQNLFMINRGAQWCSKRFCSFWDVCHDEFG
jgi:hypothetical protein